MSETRPSAMRKLMPVFLLLVALYLGTGFVFHVRWNSELAACREIRVAQGEFVEPEVFGNGIGLFFDMTYWPVYAAANISHWGTPLATPCTR